jgi:hypothetical protein
MEIIIHKVNTLKALKSINTKFGSEIDIRAWGSELVLNHEPFQNGERLVDYLDEYHHGTLVLNIKEAGIEDCVLEMVRERSHIKSFFLLDVEFPYLYRASRHGERNLAVRFSEDESINTVKKYVDKVDWVWIDTNTRLPIKSENKEILDNFKKCLVCPSRWNRPQDIKIYKRRLKQFLTAVMTEEKHAKIWSS